jgi:hypothetical protein
MNILGYRGVAFPFSGVENDAGSQNHLSRGVVTTH